MHNKIILMLIIISLAISLYSGYCQASRAYELAKAYELHGQKYVSDEIYYVDTARRYLQNIFKVHIKYYQMSGSTNPDYYNLEHPPLGKYLIAASMVLCGDKPLCWRMPGIIESFLIPPIVYLAVSRILSRESPVGLARLAAGLIAAVAAGSDRIIFMDASVAMLDIHLAFFTAITLLLLSYGRIRAASVTAGLAFMTKMTGLATIITVFLIILIKYKNKINILLKKLSESIIIITLISILIYLPLIMYFGPKEIIVATLDALKWHTTSRPPGPPVSGPTGWMVNANPFYFTYNMILAGGITTPIVEVTGFIASIIGTVYSLSQLGRSGESEFLAPGSLLVISVLLLFAIIYVLGNHTFYSFYAAVWTPGMAMALGELVCFFNATIHERC